LWQNGIFVTRTQEALKIPATGETMQMGKSERPVLVKRYAGRRLYGPAASTYLTRDDLITMAKNGEKFVVIDVDTGDDVTYSYHPIIVEH
jgi:polyhydroxyalkanoate synthesis regulator protein